MTEPIELTVHEMQTSYWIAEEIKNGDTEPPVELFAVTQHRATAEKQGLRIVGEPTLRWERPDPLSREYRHDVWIARVNSYAVEG